MPRILPFALCFGFAGFSPLSATPAIAQIRLLPAVAPEPIAHAGYLVVYSATEPFDDGDLMYYSHSDYQLYSAKWKFLRTIHNSLSKSDETPERIALRPGNYVIHAQSETDGLVAVAVAIANGQTTVVHLEGDRRGTNNRVAKHPTR